MNLKDLFELPRRGNLVESWIGDSHDAGQIALPALANPITLFAGSVVDAGLWLLQFSHSLASRGHPHDLRVELPGQGPVGFRGQAARYEKVIPSLYRHTPRERRRYRRAYKWLRVLLQAYSNDYAFQVGKFPLIWRSSEVAAIAQHYGIPTSLTDWSWDPLVALAFATAYLAPGEHGRVLITRARNSFPNKVVLPPPMATRLWIQKGFFLSHPRPEDHDRLAIEVSEEMGALAFLISTPNAYLHIDFDANSAEISEARRRIECLLARRTHLEALIEVSLTLEIDPPSLPERLSRTALRPADLQSMGIKLHELEIEGGLLKDVEVKESLDCLYAYLDSCALRSSGYCHGMISDLNKEWRRALESFEFYGAPKRRLERLGVLVNESR